MKRNDLIERLKQYKGREIKIEGQNPIKVDFDSEIFGLTEMIAWVMYFRIREKSKYGKKRYDEIIDEMILRLEIVRSLTLYRYVPISFLWKHVSKNLSEILEKGVKT